jgi:hypothetical protein
VNAPVKSSKAEAILIVDDDDLYVRSTTRLLRGLGYPFVFRAASAHDALQMLERVRPSLVLTDMVMEHRAAGKDVVEACLQLGIGVAVISGLPGLDQESAGCRFCPKSDLSGATLERLLAETLADGLRRSRSIISQRRVG